MKAQKWIRCSLRPPIVPVIPSHYIDLILYEELEPKAIWRMNLLLIALSIRTEEDDSRVFGILQRSLILYVFMPINSLQLLNCQHLLIVEGEKHAI